MHKQLLGITTVVTLWLLLPHQGYAGSWVESGQQGVSIRHPKGWQTVWNEHGVGISHPENPMIWCDCSMHQWRGTAQQFIAALLDTYRNQLQNLRVLEKKRVSKKPDTCGARFTYEENGIPLGTLVLATTGDGENVWIRRYGAPVCEYDKMKLMLIPILGSVRFEEAGPEKGSGAGTQAKLTQVLRSLHGYWQIRAPQGWKSIDMGQDESIEARCVGPNGETVGVNILCAMARILALRSRMGGASMPLQSIPYLPAAELFQQVLFPYHQTEIRDVRLDDLKSLDRDKARYRVSYTDPHRGGQTVQEGIVINNSLPDLYGGDFNVYTRYWVAAPAKSFPRIKTQLWQILQTFEPSPHFGAAVIQILMQMRQSTYQAMHNSVMNTIRTNQRMMQQTTQTTIGIMQDRRQEGIGWGLALSGEDMVRDPDTGKQYRIPMGGQYIYGRPSGAGEIETIQADGPIALSELPLGFRAFEEVPIGQYYKE